MDLASVVGRARSVVVRSEAGGANAPGGQGLLLVRAWPTGAAFAWETADQRFCTATVYDSTIGEQGCATKPLDPPVNTLGAVTDMDTLFGDGWGRLFAGDHLEVLSAACGGAPLELRRVGSLANGERTLYAVWFPDYTKGNISLSVRRDGTTSEGRLHLGEVGDRSCGETA
ncbi:hypothetical protein ACIA8O_25500 [Kitasatospora sp. NPDC051853]|uniref:hypothetical protein n=1 Tax=Kitasatospora sp. NPDC051853 TaxID=3364058 RepID=UPI0037A3E4C5